MSVVEIVREQRLTLQRALIDGNELVMFGQVTEYEYDSVQEVVVYCGKELSVEKLDLYIDYGLCSVVGYTR